MVTVSSRRRRRSSVQSSFDGIISRVRGNVDNAPVLRMRSCSHPGCRSIFTICVGCDRGQRYCSTKCRTLAPREQVRTAGRRYQKSAGGRASHRHRQQRYRDRRIGSDVASGWTNGLEPAVAQSAAHLSMPDMWGPKPVDRPVLPDTAQSQPPAAFKILRFYMIGNNLFLKTGPAARQPDSTGTSSR